MSSDRFGGLPKPGDLIEVSCGPFEHWAVYVGDGYVVHMTNIDSGISGVRLVGSASCMMSTRAVVRKDLLAMEAKGCKYRINNKFAEKMEPLCAEEIIQRAEEMVGKEIPYNLTTYNCEHFVTELRYGVPMCEQVMEKSLFASMALAVAAIFTFIFNGSRIPSSH